MEDFAIYEGSWSLLCECFIKAKKKVPSSPPPQKKKAWFWSGTINRATITILPYDEGKRFVFTGIFKLYEIDENKVVIQSYAESKSWKLSWTPLESFLCSLKSVKTSKLTKIRICDFFFWKATNLLLFKIGEKRSHLCSSRSWNGEHYINEQKKRRVD